MELDIQEPAKLKRDGKPQINSVLLRSLKVHHGCSIASQYLLDIVESITEGPALNVSAIYTHLEKATVGVPGFEIKPIAILSNFSFRKMEMVQDLSNSLEQMVDHDIIAAMAGDLRARQIVQESYSYEEIDARELDRIAPEQEFLVFDADSSQQLAIQAVLAGHNGIIQGPPGTGKSQTIANLITSLVAKGQRVLFIAEKETALEVVKQRLEERNLGHLLLNLHNKLMSSKDVIEQFKESFETLQTVNDLDLTDTHFHLQDRRRRLDQYVEQLYKKRWASNLSIHEIQEELISFSDSERTTTRLSKDEVEQISSEKANAIEQLLTEMSSSTLANLFLDTHPSPWTNTKLLSPSSDIPQVFNQVRIIAGIFKFLQASLQRLTTFAQLRIPNTLEEIEELIFLVKEVNHTLSIYSTDIFHQNLEEQIKVLSPFSPNSTFVTKLILRSSFVVEFLTKELVPKLNPNKNFNCTILQIQNLRLEGKASAREMLVELKRIDWQLKRWRSLSSDTTTPYETSVQEIFILKALFDGLRAALDKVEPYLEPYTQRYLKGRKLFRTSLDEFFNLFNSLMADQETPKAAILLREIEQKIEKLGAKSILVGFKSSESDPRLWARQFRYAWLASQLEQAPLLANFRRESHERLIAEFCELDRKHLYTTADRVHCTHAKRAIAVRNAYLEQDELVQEQVKRKGRYLPLHQLFADAPDVLTALRPCWMLSPLLVSQLLRGHNRYFDIVIFDEASQVLPEDAIPAILRAKRVVVAGDRHQLPPTKFFVKADEDEALAGAGSESLLDLMSTFLDPWLLSWHYRSRDESLIAFSNRHIHGDRLITFPSPQDQAFVSHILVSLMLEQNEQGTNSDPEIKRVVELVLEHVTKRSEETLGVITMGKDHAKSIEAALEVTLRCRPQLSSVFNKNFFVRSIEQVQGDERDAIILSLGYKKNSSGNLPHYFGPLLREGGERRLNVAITRARQRLTLVSSFDHQDIDSTRSKAQGVKLLRSYIQYAFNQGKFLEDDRSHTEKSLSSFELDIFNALGERGISLQPKVGSSQYPISMAARHPNRPGCFVLAIECDGPNYYSANTVRDRDRLRPQQLEAMNWCIHRIWSIDWFRHRDVEIERAVAAYQAAVERGDHDAQDKQYEVGTSKSKQPESIGLQSPISVPRQRQPRPAVPQYGKIDSYSQEELISLVHWIRSDGCLRTDAEILGEMLPELGFKRRGTKIEAAVRAAIEQVTYENVRRLNFSIDPRENEA